MASTPDRTETDRPDGGASLASLGDPGEQEAALELPTVDPALYDVRGEIARGGMGRILEATDLRLERPVALKQLLVNSPRHAQLFEREIRITARLQHPAIVSVYEAGRLPSGELFYAMKLVAGRPLAKAIADTENLEQRMGLLPAVTAVCEALAYAHQKRIIHRDLKPSNVLVGDFGETVVIDWGLAKDLSRDAAPAPEQTGDGHPDPSTGSALHTVSGKAVGTPAYMPPEQARGEHVDERSDVYALGAMLYHVLCGQRPYSGDDSTQIVAQVCDGPPRPLSSLEARTPIDLLTLVERAMSRDPARRYPSAVELAADLRRFQTGQLVTAHRYSRRQLLARWVKRHRAEVSVVVVALVLLSVLSVIGVRRIIRERDLASSRADQLTLAQAQSSLESDPASALRSLQTLPANAPVWGPARVLASDARERGVGKTLARHVAEVSHVAAAQGGATVASASEDGAVALRENGGRARLLWSHNGPITALGFDPSGRWLASASRDATIGLRDLAGGSNRLLQVGGGKGLPITQLAFSADGTQLVSADSRGGLRLWTTLSGQSVALSGQPAAVLALAMSAEGTVAAVDGDGTLRSWISGARIPVEQELGVTVSHASFTASGDTLVLASPTAELWIWRQGWPAAKRIGTLDAPANRLWLSPDGTQVAATADQGSPSLWNTTRPGPVTLGHPGASRVHFLAGDLIATGGRDSVVRLWNQRGEALRELRGHHATITGLASAGPRLYTASADRGVREWELLPHSPRRLEGHSAWVSRVVFGPEGSLISSGWDGAIRVWQLDSDQARVLRGHSGAVHDLAVSADGTIAASGGDDRSVRLWKILDGTSQLLGSHQRAVRAVAITADGTVVASAGDDNVVRLWTVADGRARVLVGHTGPVTSLAFSADGTRLASASEDGTARLWLSDGHELRRVDHGSPVTSVAFAPNGAWMASAGLAQAVVLSPSGTGRDRILRGHDGPVRSLAFGPKSERLASSSDDMTVRLWKVDSGRARTLLGHRDFVTRVRFGKRGRTLVTASEDGQVMVWDAQTGTKRALPARGWLTDVAVSPDGDQIAACGADRAVFLWRDDLPRRTDELRSWLNAQVARQVPIISRSRAP